MGLPTPAHNIGFTGTIVGGEHDAQPIRIVGGCRPSDSLLVEVGTTGVEVVGAMADLVDLDKMLGATVQWPSAAERAAVAASQVGEWFAERGDAVLQEPFAGASLNAQPSVLISCSAEEGAVLVEFEATWDVRMHDIVVLDVGPHALSLLAERAELTQRHPFTAPSVSQLRLVPFVWSSI